MNKLNEEKRHLELLEDTIFVRWLLILPAFTIHGGATKNRRNNLGML